VPPFGFERRLRIFIDPDLLQYDEVWAAAGTWNDVFPIAPDDLVHASGAAVTELRR
jgi:prolyl-tRNA editing enzyme YbaK/EbsC (Cys-tRNA(Pro) deacylase)